MTSSSKLAFAPASGCHHLLPFFHLRIAALSESNQPVRQFLGLQARPLRYGQSVFQDLILFTGGNFSQKNIA